jgi:hypothetical protein
MAKTQLEAFGEIFNSKGAIQRFRNRNYACPFDRRISDCDKPNRGPLKYGNCSAEVGNQKRIICPRRFYENNYKILRQIKSFIWGEDTIINGYYELNIQMRTADGDKFHYGNLDWVLVNNDNHGDFCGVEIQTDSTTGTGAFKTAIDDLLNNNLRTTYNFGLNTLASFKGFLPQFIFKGQLFDDWKKPYIAVIQDELWLKFKSKFRIRYKPITKYTSETFLFFVYSLVFNVQSGKYELSNPQVYSSRWIDLLFSFSVENELLVDLNGAVQRIEKKIDNIEPFITMD